MRDIIKRSVAEHSLSLAKKEYSALELTRAYLERIEECEPEINAFITTDAEGTLKSAQLSDERRAKGGELSALDGIPVAVKDNICTAGMRTTCASKMLVDYMPPYDATVIKKLKAAGAIIIGKTNMDEFAIGSTGESSCFGSTKNPRDPSLTPGGSSSGSAAAVAACEVPMALGSDTGGSVRLPAAYCSVVGMKPTYSRVSRYGLVAHASSLEQIGTLTCDVRSSAMLLSVIAGKDERDMTSADCENSISLCEYENLNGIRLGVIRELMSAEICDKVKEDFEHSLALLRSLGAQIVDISIPSLPHALPAYYIISSAEASSNLARYDGIRYTAREDGAKTLSELYKSTRTSLLGDETRRRILLGSFALSEGYYGEYYEKATDIKRALILELESAFKACDAIICPTSPRLPESNGQKVSDPTQIYAQDICCVPANIAGLPALSIPSPVSSLLSGLQFMGRKYDESLLYSIAHAVERAGDVR